MSFSKKSSKSLLKESLKLLDDSDKTSGGETTSSTSQRKFSSKKDILHRTSSIKEIERVKSRLKRKEGLADENLKKLKLLNQSLKEKTAKKILERVGYKSDADLAEADKKKDDGKTVFTEEDFAKFEREYFAC